LQYGRTRQDLNGTTQFNLGSDIGLRNVLGNYDGEFANKRFNASASFMTIKGGLSRLQSLGSGWWLSGSVDGQLASGPLISNEQYGAGGADTVRGYFESEVLGDVGARGSMELRRFLPSGGGAVKEAYVFGYLEGAVAHIFDALPGQQASFNISSAGLGLRLKAWRGLRFWLDFGQAFKATQYTPKNAVRTLFRLGYEF